MFILFLMLAATDAVTLTGSSEYAFPGTEFTLTCDVPEEAVLVEFYRPDVITPVVTIQVAGGQCYNSIARPPVPCTADVCSCVMSGGNIGTVFRWIIQPQTGDQGSVWFCTRTNLDLPNQTLDSDYYTLNLADGPGTSIALNPPDTTYARTEGETLPDITCTADCRPGCTFVWTRPDNTNFTVSPVLSLGELDKSEHGTYRCTARNVVGESSVLTTVNVQYDPGTSIALSPSDTTYTRTEGDTLPDITCTADCRPNCTFVWTRPDNTNFTMSPLLSLGQLDRSEHGMYRCTARNYVGESTTNINVNILYGPSTVILTPPTVTYTLTEGQTIPTITCSADCNPACTYSWTKDGQSYRTGSGLQLTNIQRGQTGVYRCTASNVHGSATAMGINVSVYYSPGTSIALSPTDTTYTRTEGDTLPDITCTADCRPGCTFVWTRPDNTNFTVSPVLSLGQLDRSEHGTYRCTTRNAVGESTKNVNVNILYPPLITDISFMAGDGNLTEGSSISLVCTVESLPPSTIQWLFKANGTVLLTSPDVLESTYTLTNAGCLDTGLYTCSANNSVSKTVVAKDLKTNVYCKPRKDHRTMNSYKFGLAVSENLTMSAMFLANPEPSFNWALSNSSGKYENELLDGMNNFAINNYYVLANLSAVSIGIRTRIQEHWYGTYYVTATNSEGNGTISFVVEPQGKPNPPDHVTAVCLNQKQAILSWRSAFNGGSNQTFLVGKRRPSDDIYVIDKTSITLDPGQHKTATVYISDLTANTLHFFTVFAVNKFGNASFESEVNCTTKAIPASSPLGVILGSSGGSIAAIIVIIVIIVLAIKRKAATSKRDDATEMINGEVSTAGSSDGLKPNILYESSDGLKANVLYEPLPGNSSEYAVVQKKTVSPNDVYAVVDKSKKENLEAKSDLYAEVVKPKGKTGKGGKGGKGKHKEEGQKKRAEDVYENVSDIKDAMDNTYTNGENEPNPASNEGPSRKKTKDGLIYLDIEFKDGKQNGRNYVIHGIENRTDYADVDFSKRADPLPSDSE